MRTSSPSLLDQDAVVAHSMPRPAAPERLLPYAVFTLCASLYLFPFMRLLLQGTDEGTLADGAVRVAHGQVFARDFFEVIGPGTFYWLALFFKLFGVTFLAERICLFIVSLGTGLAMYYLSRRVCQRFLILPCLLLVGTYFGMLWPTVSHHVDSNCFALFAVVCLAVWQKKQSHWTLALSGALAGATTCILQPKGILLLFALLIWLWIQGRHRAVRQSSFWAVVVGYASVMMAVGLYFQSQHALWSLVDVNFLWPAKHYGTMNAVPYAHGIFAYYWDHWVGVKAVGRWIYVVAALLITPFLLVATLPALLPVIAVLSKRNAESPEVLLYWLCGVALWVSEFHRKDISHLVFGAPLFVILFVFYLQQRRTRTAELSLQVLTISAVCLAGFNLFLVASAHSMNTRMGTVAVFNDDPILKLLDDKVASGGAIFAYPYCPMYYFLSATTNPTRYSFLMYNYNTPAQFEDAVSVVEQRAVKYVVWDKTFQANAASLFFPGSSPVASGALIVEPYLASHYEVLKDEGGVLFLERKHAR